MEFEVIRSKRKTLAVEIKNNKLAVRAPFFTSNREIQAFLQKNSDWIDRHITIAQARQDIIASQPKLTEAEIKALTAQAARKIPERVAYYAPLVGVDYGKITIRHQHSRWGSCTAGGNLSFNCLLMLTPPEVLDSVVVHELCHRREMNHSPRFYAELLRVFPQYPECRKWLKSNGAMLLARLDK